MSNNARPRSALAWTSFWLGLLGLAIIAVVAIASRVSSFGTALNNLGLQGSMVIVAFIVIGGLGLLAGVGGVIAILSRGRRGWVPAILGILLGVVNVLIGLAGLAVSSIKLNLGPF
jgi:hypothetical protein